MKLYLFIGQSERTYPDIVIDGKVLVANPGDDCKFGVPPTDGLWVEAPAPTPAKPAKASKES